MTKYIVCLAIVASLAGLYNAAVCLWLLAVLVIGFVNPLRSALK